MTTKEAIEHELSKGITKYRIAQLLHCAPVSVNQWLRGTKMSDMYKDKFKEVFGVEIDDSL